MRKVAGQLKGAFTLVVTGYTDAPGSEASNQALGLQRAKAVASVLANSGVPLASINTAGVGSGNSQGVNKSSRSRATPKRIEIEIQMQDSPVATPRTPPPAPGHP